MHRLRLSLFEKVILANSVMLIGVALVGLWVTSHSLEAHHYLIDTSFIVIATLLGLLINVLLLRASFRPLFSLLQTIRVVSAGNTHTRAKVTTADSEIGELAYAFNTMLDRLEQTRREQAMVILQAQGGAFLYPGLAKALIRSYVASPETATPALQDHTVTSSLAQTLRVLTPREVEVLRLVAEGRTNQEIADQLTLSIKTVQTHRANVMEKLDLRDITHLVRFAVRHKLIAE